MDYVIPSLVVGTLAYVILRKPAQPAPPSAPDAQGIVAGVMSGKLATALPTPLNGYETRPFVADYSVGHAQPAYEPSVIMGAYSSFETDPQNPQPPPPVAGMYVGKTMAGRPLNGVSKTEGLGVFQEINPPLDEEFVAHDGNPAPKMFMEAVGIQKANPLEGLGMSIGTVTMGHASPDIGMSGIDMGIHQGFGGLMGGMPMGGGLPLASGGFGGLMRM